MSNNYFIVLFLFGQFLFSQVKQESVDKLNKLPFTELSKKDKSKMQQGELIRDGDVRFTVSQSYFSNWIRGGKSSLASQFLIDYGIIYKNESGLVWDNEFTFSLGGAYVSGSEGIKKADDQFIWNSLVGFNRKKLQWNFSIYYSLKTQILSGFKYSSMDDREIKTKESAFFSPGIIQLGLGVFRINEGKSRMNFSPLTTQLVVINKNLAAEYRPNKSYFGVPPGKSSQGYFGASLNGYYKKEIWENISLDYRYDFYANYLKEFSNIDFKQSITLNFKVNRYISCTMNAELIYDDDLLSDLQVKEIFGLGLNLDI
ncbi:MAG: DUF3078 domain-containing protein [Flavobacteriaceae bacterium]|nr:DUF3078 domain-containing protein [Flavobacteriaceae bacterium]